MKALLQINHETEKELMRFRVDNEATTALFFIDTEGVFTETQSFQDADYLEVEITIDQLNFKPRKKREGE